MYGTRIQHFIIDANERLTVLFRDKRTTQMACERHFSFFFFAFLLLVLISREFCFKYDGYQIRVTRDWIDLCTVYFCFAMLCYAYIPYDGWVAFFDARECLLMNTNGNIFMWNRRDEHFEFIFPRKQARWSNGVCLSNREFISWLIHTSQAGTRAPV